MTTPLEPAGSIASNTKFIQHPIPISPRHSSTSTSEQLQIVNTDPNAILRLPPLKLKPFTTEWWYSVRSSSFSIVFSVTFAVFTDIFVYSVVVPVIPYVLEDRLGIASADIQTNISKILAMYSVGLIVGSLVFGYIADKIKHRRFIMLVGLSLLVGANFILMFSKWMWLYMVGRVVQGLSASVVWVVGLAIIADIGDSSNIAYLMSYPGMGLSLGMFMGPLIGGIVYDRAGYLAVFIVCFGVLVIDILLRIFMLEKSQVSSLRAKRAKKLAENLDSLSPTLREFVRRYLPETAPERQIVGGDNIDYLEEEIEAEKPKPADFKFYMTIGSFKFSVPAYFKLLMSARILNVCFITIVMAWIITSFETILTLRVEDKFHFNPLQAGLLILAFAGPSFAEPYIGHLSDRAGPRWIVFVALILATPPLILLRIPTEPSAGHIALLSVLLVWIGTCTSALFAPVTGEFSNAVTKFEGKRPGCLGKGRGFGQVYGLFNVAYSLGSLIGPFMSGGIVASSGWGTAVLALGIVSFASAFVTFPFTGGNLFAIRRKTKLAEKNSKDLEYSEGTEEIAEKQVAGDLLSPNYVANVEEVEH